MADSLPPKTSCSFSASVFTLLFPRHFKLGSFSGWVHAPANVPTHWDHMLTFLQYAQCVLCYQLKLVNLAGSLVVPKQPSSLVSFWRHENCTSVYQMATSVKCTQGHDWAGPITNYLNESNYTFEGLPVFTHGLFINCACEPRNTGRAKWAQIHNSSPGKKTQNCTFTIRKCTIVGCKYVL